MTWLYAIITLGYLILVLGLVMEAFDYQTSTRPEKAENWTGFTVIINYRNEAKNLPHLLDAVKALDYDPQRVQWIFVNDDSTDESLVILKAFKENTSWDSLLLNRQAHTASAKKDGITQAIARARFEHIICTDADCLLPPTWLKAYHGFYTAHPEAQFVAGPVQITTNSNWISHLQSNEMMALQMTSIGGFGLGHPFLCNGANMSFRATAFSEVKGYTGNAHLSSGDDVFLLEKLAQWQSENCYYLKNKEAIVSTTPKNTWLEMIQQRARWAQKAGKTKSFLNAWLSIQVLLMNLAFISIPLWVGLGLMSWKIGFATVLSKLLADGISLILAEQFYEEKAWRKSFFICFFIYPIMVIQIAIWSLKKNQWHGRQVRLQKSAEK